MWNHHKIGINGSQKNTVDPDDTPTQEEVEIANATDKVTGGESNRTVRLLILGEDDEPGGVGAASAGQNHVAAGL